MVIARTRHDEYQYEGVRIVDIADWLLEQIDYLPKLETMCFWIIKKENNTEKL